MMGDETRRPALAFSRTARIYWLEIFPLAKKQIARWRARAALIPDTPLRANALLSLCEKGQRPEGLAAFALLAGEDRRSPVVRATVAYQVIVDYIDTVSEQQALSRVANTLKLHGALEAAIDDEAPAGAYYALGSPGEDGGYLQALIEETRSSLRELGCGRAVRLALRRKTNLAAEAQCFNHGLLGGWETAVPPWAEQRAAQLGLQGEVEWWEMLAAGASPLGTGALLGAAGGADRSACEVEGIEAAYTPWIEGLAGMLDALVDVDVKCPPARHLARYGSKEEAARRLRTLAEEGMRQARQLPDAGLHELLLLGVIGYFLAKPAAWKGDNSAVAGAVLGSLGGMARPILAAHCVRQRTPRIVLRALRVSP